ncbi:MAG: hypothetical protein KDK33_06735 [Leptospiraceae bacterium]|nr:hypothetical protein [Leptospiraceae bacterium]
MQRLSGFLLSATLLFLVADRLQALPLADPELNYRTYRTEHFAIHFPEGYLDNARRLGKVAEDRYRSMEPRFYSGIGVTNLILIPNTDTVNAFASTYGPPRVALYLQSPNPGEFAHFGVWQTEVFTHEYTHILTMYPYSGLINLAIRILGGLPPNNLTPVGLVEGFPVYEESQRGNGRLNDPRTNMVLRTAALEGEFPALEEMLAGTHRWPRGQVHYLYGGRFVQFLRQNPEYLAIGAAQKLDQYFLLEEPALLPSERLQKLGYPELEEIYAAFREYESVRARSEQLLETPFQRITHSGFSKEFLQLNGDRLYFFGASKAGSGIYSITAHSADVRMPANPPQEPIAKPDGAPSANDLSGSTDMQKHSLSYFRNPSASGGFTVLSKNDSVEILSSEDGYSHNASGFRYQLYGSNTLGLYSISEGERIVFPSRRGNSIAYIKREDPYRYLILAELDAEGQIVNERTMLRTDLYGILSNSSMSNDGRWVIALFRPGLTGAPGLVRCSTGTLRCENLIPAGLENLSIAQPSFVGEDLLFSSDRTGRFELYRLRLKGESRSVEQLTTTNTGLFYPVAVSSDLYALRYFADGYDVVRLSGESLIHKDATDDFLSARSGDRNEADFSLPLESATVSDYDGVLEVRPYFAGLLFSVTQAESGIVAFDPMERHTFSAGIGFLEDTPYFSTAYQYNRFAHSFNAYYVRSSLKKRQFYCDAPSGPIIFLCQDDDYQFEYGGLSISREIPGRQFDQEYAVGLSHEKHRNSDSLAAYVFPARDINLSSVYAGYGFSNATYYPESISPERGFSFYGEGAFYPEDWVVIFDDRGKGTENAEFYTLNAQLDFFLPSFFDNHVPYLGAIGRWSGGKDPEIYRVRLSSYMRGQDPNYSTFGRGALTLTAEYRFPLLWLSRRIVSWWPSLDLRYISFAPFFDYGQSFDRQIYRDTWVRSYGAYADFGLNVFYLPVAFRIIYARGEGFAGETSFAFALVAGSSSQNHSMAQNNPLARALFHQANGMTDRSPVSF